MKIKCYFSLLLILFLLIACSGQVTSDSIITQQPSSTPGVTAIVTTPKLVDATPTHTLIPTVTAEVPSVQTPTFIAVENLPQLNEVILSSVDFETIEFDYNPLLLVADATNELQGSCLWDCAKYRYSLKYGTMTIMLLRTGDRQKAGNTLDNLKKTSSESAIMSILSRT